MKIAVISHSPEGDDCKSLAALLRERVRTANIVFCGFEEIFYDRTPLELDAAFVCVDTMRALEGARKIGRLQVPMVVVSSSPDYATEAFRIGAKHYIIHPVREADVREAMLRCTAKRQMRSRC